MADEPEDWLPCRRCGGAWFDVRPMQDNGPMAVCLDRNGLIVAHTLAFACQECGETWDGTAPRLRLVERTEGRE